MAAITDLTAARVRVAPIATPTAFSLLGFVRSGGYDRGREGSTTLDYLGGSVSKAGTKTLTASVNVFYDFDDAGQDIVRAGYNNNTKIIVEFAPEGTAATRRVIRFEADVETESANFDVTGDGLEGSFTFNGSPSTYTEVTLV